MFFICSQTGMLTFGPKDSEELKEKSENLVKQGQSYEFFTASEVGLLSDIMTSRDTARTTDIHCVTVYAQYTPMVHDRHFYACIQIYNIHTNLCTHYCIESG
jgi:hypothetical protein